MVPTEYNNVLLLTMCIIRELKIVPKDEIFSVKTLNKLPLV